ncbi:MAG: UPF0280 family protein [Afipia sp.]|nr:UPF0280 family protein [Afipia sp.]
MRKTGVGTVRIGPRVKLLADGKRLHLQEGPIDLIIGADGMDRCVRLARNAAWERFKPTLSKLCDELPLLRQPALAGCNPFRGKIARRMHDAVRPFAAGQFITPMAAVAGAVADEILEAMVGAADLDRAYVNNGGDIAIHLGPDQKFVVGLIDRPDCPSLVGSTVIAANSTVRGIATSGRYGRSFTFGIADAVTVLACTASQADAAATIIGNAVDLPGHTAIKRCPASEIQFDTDLGNRLITRELGDLSHREIADALDAGCRRALTLLQDGLIEAAALQLRGISRVVGTTSSSHLSLP